MTNEGTGYSVDDITGYTKLPFLSPSIFDTWIVSMRCADYGMIPKTGGGSSSTFYCDTVYNSQIPEDIKICLVGGSAYYTVDANGIFTFNTNNKPTSTSWSITCNLFCEQPVSTSSKGGE